MSALTFDIVDQLAAWGTEHPELAPKPEDAEKIRGGMVKYFQQSVVLKQYVKHLDEPGNPRNRFGWHAHGERLYAAFLLSQVGAPGGPGLMTAAGEALEDHLGLGIAMQALLAQVYLWSNEIETLADSTPLPPHVISRDVLPHPVMFWSRETAFIGPDFETNWMLLMHTIHGIRVVADLVYAPGELKLLVGDVEYGTRYPEDFGDRSAIDGLAKVLGRLSFLASPYISPLTEHVPRAWRREEMRSGLTAAQTDPEIRVVTLRHDVAQRVSQEREDRAAPREWNKHWWVSGHHRAQWYPSKQAHEVIWIAPYLKGNLDAPFQDKIYRVVR